MLRCRFTSSKAVASFSTAAASLTSIMGSPLTTPSLATQQRNIAVFSQQNDALDNAAKYKGYKSPVWFEEEDLYGLSQVDKLKPNQEPVQIRGLRRIELYNGDQLVNTSELPNEPETHSSLRTGAGYSGRFQRDLEKIAEKHNYQSKWWFSAREIQKRNLRLKRFGGMSRVNPIMITANMKCYNADQFENPARVAIEPVSGLTRKILGKSSAEALVPVCQKEKYPTGVFFTKRQLENLDLASLLKADAVPYDVSVPDRISLAKMRENRNNNGPEVAKADRTFYNITELKDYKNIMKSMGRFPIDHPAYLSSGKPIASAIFFEKLKESTTFSYKEGEASENNYWLTTQDIAANNYSLVPNAQGIHVSQGDKASSADSGRKPETQTNNITIQYYNVHQLTDPDRALKVAGTKTM